MAASSGREDRERERRNSWEQREEKGKIKRKIYKHISHEYMTWKHREEKIENKN